MKQLVLDIVPSPPPALTNFVPGRNAELLQTLDNILAGAEREHFVYLWGRTGCGRSHLLQGVAGLCMRNKMRAAYIACDANTDFVANGEADCVAVDDVDRLNAEAQIGLFNLYNRIRDEGHALLLVSGPAAPAQLKLKVREDLVTRLGWGLVYQVHELTDEEKIKAMKSHAANRGLDLPQEVCGYLLRHGRRDLPSLMATLDALDSYSLANQRKVTVPLVRELLQITS
ncbi:regulatory inactivation of DnaA Hda protein [Nitrosospira sp. Nl5]|uniref:DnaA regulatory inactivator Hda n=1 Tax=Nitrosospira sp. Nl5 TaxID=200120 RepID=UPI00088C299C|nr:DnaA regulatory inactivator Hda [Nitrosospira sp. Nl5]SCY53228.1 regulatory inactivation of DnaA Hda protein [Nitrosospira sp. Nl5]